MQNITNASPQIRFLGTDDKSIRVLKPTPIPIPQHLPKIYIFAKKGNTNSRLASGPDMIEMYGAETFDKLSKWYNHATHLASVIAGNAILLWWKELCHMMLV